MLFGTPRDGQSPAAAPAPQSNATGKARITPEAIAAYQHALKLHNNPKAVDVWEEDGGRRREYLDACSELQCLLGRGLGDEHVLDTLGFDELPTELPYKPWDDESWKEAFAIRLELERLCR